jgi:hypothetical protein
MLRKDIKYNASRSVYLILMLYIAHTSILTKSPQICQCISIKSLTIVDVGEGFLPKAFGTVHKLLKQHLTYFRRSKRKKDYKWKNDSELNFCIRKITVKPQVAPMSSATKLQR